MRTPEHIEKYRRTTERAGGIPEILLTTAADGMNGVFEIPFEHNPKVHFLCIVSDGSTPDGKMIDWEHVSVRAGTMNDKKKRYERVPNWMEMCWLKELFWNDDECVIQFHPAKSEHVNFHPNVLHLWRYLKADFPVPEKCYV